MWNFDKKFDTILESPNPPTLVTLKLLPEFTSGDEYGSFWCNYFTILQKPEQSPSIYIGSWTDKNVTVSL